MRDAMARAATDEAQAAQAGLAEPERAQPQAERKLRKAELQAEARAKITKAMAQAAVLAACRRTQAAEPELLAVQRTLKGESCSNTERLSRATAAAQPVVLARTLESRGGDKLESKEGDQLEPAMERVSRPALSVRAVLSPRASPARVSSVRPLSASPSLRQHRIGRTHEHAEGAESAASGEIALQRGATRTRGSPVPAAVLPRCSWGCKMRVV